MCIIPNETMQRIYGSLQISNNDEPTLLDEGKTRFSKKKSLAHPTDKLYHVDIQRELEQYQQTRRGKTDTC